MVDQLEPCVSCGEATAPGSPLYFDRTAIDPGSDDPRFMCSLCVQRLAGGRRKRPLTEDERKALENAALAFGSFLPGGH